MSDPQILDERAMERLREWGGDKLASQMVQLFLDNSPARMEQIRSGVAEGDAKEAERGAHSLKSSSANVGAEQVRKLATEIEGAAGRNDLSAVSELVQALEQAYARTRAALEAVERGNEE